MTTHRSPPQVLALGEHSFYEPVDKTPPIAGAVLGKTSSAMEPGVTACIRQDYHPLIYRASRGYGHTHVVDPTITDLWLGTVPYGAWCWLVPE